uniref:Uncharacterized protein n=1 Tax=Vitrella brassicaformis TaxID=1169539 RepID=A0A7S1JLQ0_9ALVE
MHTRKGEEIRRDRTDRCDVGWRGWPGRGESYKTYIGNVCNVVCTAGPAWKRVVRHIDTQTCRQTYESTKVSIQPKIESMQPKIGTKALPCLSVLSGEKIDTHVRHVDRSDKERESTLPYSLQQQKTERALQSVNQPYTD